MKQLLIIFFLFALSIQLSAQQYRITAHLSGFKANTKFYLKDLNLDTDIDSALLKNDSLVMRGMFKETPALLWFYADEQPHERFHYAVLLMGNEAVHIIGDAKDFPYDLQITGSPIQDDENVLVTATRKFNKRRDSLLKFATNLEQMQGMAVEWKKLWDQINKGDDSLLRIKTAFIMSHPNSHASLVEIGFWKEKMSRDSIQKVYGSLSPEYKESIYGKRIGAFLKVNKVLNPGDMFSDFQAYDQRGKLRKLSEFKSKYILLEFSETNCGPCMMAVKELKAIAGERKDKLAIVTFSGDANKDTWKQGLERDKPSWPCLWDGQGTYSPTVLTYHVEGYPSFVLIDPSGKIVSKWTGYGPDAIKKNLDKVLPR